MRLKAISIGSPFARALGILWVVVLSSGQNCVPENLADAGSGGTPPVDAGTVSRTDFTQKAANLLPQADGQFVTTKQNTAVQIVLGGNDPDQHALTFTVTNAPTHGELSAVASLSDANAIVTYTPASGYAGSDAFAFRVNDGTGDSPSALVTITVTAAPSSPPSIPIPPPSIPLPPPSASPPPPSSSAVGSHSPPPSPPASAGLLTTYYVDTNHAAASDTNPGTEALPFKTIQKAADMVQPGDTVYVKSGTYSEEVKITASGTAAQPITFKACPGETVVLDGASAQWAGFQILTQLYNVIEGFEIRNYTGHGVYLENDSNYCIIRGCRIHNCTGSGVYIRGADHVLVEYNELYSNRRYGALVNWRDTTRNRSEQCVIAHNIVYDNGLFDSREANVDGLSGMATSDSVWEYNIVYYNADDGIDISSSGGCTDYPVNAILRYNVTFRNGFKMATGLPSVWAGNGIKVSTNAGGGHTLHHNVNFLNKRGGVDQDIEAGWDGNKYYNNVAWRNGIYSTSVVRVGFALEGSSDEQGRAMVMNNIGWGNDPANLDGYNSRGDFFTKMLGVNVSDYNCWGTYRWQDPDPGHEERSHSILGRDPKFVNPDGVINTNYSGTGGVAGKWQFIWDQVYANFKLRSDSPCVSAGVAIPGITDGSMGSSPDMGAFGHTQ